MAFEDRDGGIYFTILGGKFAIKLDPKLWENKSDAELLEARVVKRINKAGKTVYERYHNSFTGKLIGIKTQDSTAYGKNWLFSFQDGGEVYNLTLSYSNSFATAFLKTLPNIDLSKEMKVQPSVKEVDGKDKSSLFVSQDGVTLKHAYTRENPNGMPDMEQITVKGILQWDDTKRINWLHDMVVRDIIPKLPKRQEVAQKSSGLSVDNEESVDDMAKDIADI